jgi:hypothetical protein
MINRSGESSLRSSLDPEEVGRYLETLGGIYGTPGDDSHGLSPTRDVHENNQGGGDKTTEQQEEEFAFRLFASEPARKIVIKEEDVGQGAFVGARDPRIFILGRAEGERKRGFESVAVSGEEVIRRKGLRAWGLEVPWRVLVVRDGRSMRSSKGSEVVEEEKEGDIKGRKKRAGKKRRILIRVRKRKEQEVRERRKKEEAEKEERKREKRTRRNREKKVKRKMKEKAKKAGNGEGGAAADETSTAGDGQGD